MGDQLSAVGAIVVLLASLGCRDHDEAPRGTTAARALAPGRPWFCRTILFHDREEHETRRLGYCAATLALCDANPSPGDSLYTGPNGNGTSVRVVSRCEEYPLAFCYITEARNFFCFTDSVLCARARAEDDGPTEECTPMAQP